MGAGTGSVQFGATTENVNALAKSARTIRKELLMMPTIGCQATLQHMTLRPGIRFSETVGQMAGDLQFGPYNKDRINKDDVTINPRELFTYFGSVVQEFDPNSVYQSLWGAAITKGEGLKSTDITRQVLTFLMAKLGKNLNANIFKAVRNATGTKTADLFDGFDTITGKEITVGGISEAKGNLFSFSEAITNLNAVELLKAYYRSASDELRGDNCEQVNTKLFIPRFIYDAYNDDYQATVGATPYNREYKKTFLEGTDNTCELVPLVNKKGSPYLHLTTKNNMLIGVNQVGEEEQITVEKHAAFTLQFIATMFFGCQFETISPERLLVGKLYVPPIGG